MLAWCYSCGDSLLFIGGILYPNVPLWACWLVFAGACAASMIMMLAMVKWLERVLSKITSPIADVGSRTTCKDGLPDFVSDDGHEVGQPSSIV